MQSTAIHTRGSGRTLAVSAVVGVVGTLGYMYVAGKQTKREEGPASIYNDSKGLNPGTSDARMSSSQVRETVQGERKP
ncbi:hypothetical protein C8Q80DRAFT_1334293 [Daedaleopsis nitida]|nr:hypothetical protein C8Q80DRAFT_1334293 [Daedaleopsis nitida]